MMARWKRDLVPENSLVGDNSNLKSLLMREKFKIEENGKIKEKQTEKKNKKWIIGQLICDMLKYFSVKLWNSNSSIMIT